MDYKLAHIRAHKHDEVHPPPLDRLHSRDVFASE